MTQADEQTQAKQQSGQKVGDEGYDDESVSSDGRPSGQLSFWQTLLSVGQASFGVQNSKNKKRDFEKGSIKGFVAAALIFTVVFVLTLVVVVNVVLG